MTPTDPPPSQPPGPTLSYAGPPGKAPPGPAAAVIPPEPPGPPREITPAVRKRSWGEPGVRFFWLGALAMLAIGVWFVGEQVYAYRLEERLIRIPPINATIHSVGGDSRVGAKFLPESRCTLEFQFNGQKVSLSGVLQSQRDFISPGQIIPLHVDPSDPSIWTDRDTAEPMGGRLIAGILILPLALIGWLIAVIRRKRVLSAWKEGQAVAHSVVDVHSSALAPRSHAVRCVVMQGRDRSPVTVFISGRLPKPRQGDVLWLLQSPGKRASIAYGGYESIAGSRP